MILSPTFVFIHIPKTAGRSVQRALGTKATMPMEDHVTARDIESAIGIDDYMRRFSFAFVRDPWQLEVSLYFHTLSRRSHEFHDEVASAGSFRNYILWSTQARARTPQHEYILDDDGQVMVDFVGRFEQLKQDFSVVCDRIGRKGTELPHVGAGKYGDWQTYYDNDTIAAISAYYQKDIELFGYKPPIVRVS